MNATIKTRQQTRAGEGSQTGLDTISKGAIATMAGISTVIGVWATVSFVGAMITSGGPLALAIGWFQAVTGM